MLKGLRQLASRGAKISLWIVTFVIAGLGALAYFESSNSAEAANFGNFVAGIASALALIWLVAGYRLQFHELINQRRELELQRIALEQQAKELSNSAKLSSLGQIKSLLESAETAIVSSPLGVSGITQIYPKFMGGMEHWKVILESEDATEVMAAYRIWLPIEVLTRNYVRYVSSAMRLYLEFHFPDANVDYSLNPEDFTYINQSWVYNAPFLSHHIGPAGVLAQHLMMMKPGLERLQLAWLVASAKVLGKNFFKDEALEQLREKVLKHSGSLPAVCTPWPKN